MSANTAPARRTPITREAVLDAALAVIDDHGVDGLTMRRLGEALSADPMAAYLHFTNKAALVEALVDVQMARLFDPPEITERDLIEVLVALGCHYRTLLLEHPNLAPLIANRPVPPDVAADGLLLAVGLLRRSGFDPDAIPLAVDAIVTYTFGFVLYEAQQLNRTQVLDVTFEAQQQNVLDAIVEDSPDAEVACNVVLRRMKPDAGSDDFASGLRVLVIGLRDGLGDRR